MKHSVCVCLCFYIHIVPNRRQCWPRSASSIPSTRATDTSGAAAASPRRRHRRRIRAGRGPPARAAPVEEWERDSPVRVPVAGTAGRTGRCCLFPGTCPARTLSRRHDTIRQRRKKSNNQLFMEFVKLWLAFFSCSHVKVPEYIRIVSLHACGKVQMPISTRVN